MASFRAGPLNIIKRLAGLFTNRSIRQAFEQIAQDKGMAALIGQAIGDNFAQEGPGWAPLSPATIRASVSKRMRKKLRALSDSEVVRHEMLSRIEGANPLRRILVKTGLLKKSVSAPFMPGNIYKVEGTNIIWGSNISYASMHNRGDAKRHVPKREFLKIRPEWEKRLNEYAAKRVKTHIRGLIRQARSG